jgi:hypothetical protein
VEAPRDIALELVIGLREDVAATLGTALASLVAALSS